MRNRIITDKVIEDLRNNKLPIISKCSKDDVPCSRTDGEFCKVYFNPTAVWRRGCPMADDHLKDKIVEVVKEKSRVGQQKQKKKK